MCATGAQTTLQDEEMQTLQEYNKEQSETYANQTALYAEVKSVLDPVLKAGENQEGYSAAELNNLNAQAVEGTAENYASASKATSESLAAEGGGTNPLPSGAQSQLKSQVANSAAQEESKEESEITSANYEQGRKNFQNAEEGEMAIAAGEDPTKYASAATSAANTANSEANTIASESTSWLNAALGAAGSLGSAAIKKWG